MPDWYDEREYLDQDDGNVIKEYDITATPNDFNIKTLFSLIDSGVIRMPPFQRNYVWDIKRASKLIESIILGLPVPQVFLYEKEKNTFYVIDGQQRLLSIYFFIKQRFPTAQGKVALREYLTGDASINNDILSSNEYFSDFSLKLPSPVQTEKNKFDSIKYETLGEYKNTFELLRTVRSVVIKQNEPKDDSSIYEIFSRLNTGGQNLSQQEIRMSLYYSDFYKVIIELNQNAQWRRILNQKTPDIHFKDVEILIRAFAMLFNHKTYSRPMSKFLNAFSKQAQNFDRDMIKYLIALFDSFLNSCKNIPHERFTSKTGQFRISLFESIFVAACWPSFEHQKTLNRPISLKSIDALRNDAKLFDATQENVASKNSVMIRISRANTLIKFE